MIIGVATNDPWFWVAALAATTAVGLLWAIIRERHLVDLNRDQTLATQNIAHAIDGSTIAVQMSLESLSELLRAVERQLERSEGVSEKHREEFIRLSLDIERRIGDLLRDLLGSRLPQTGVTITGGQNNIGQTEIQGNQRQQ